MTPNPRIYLRCEGFGDGGHRLIKDLVAFSHPTLIKDVQQMHVGTAEVLQQPGEHSSILAIKGVINHWGRLIIQTSSAEPTLQLRVRQELAFGVEGFVDGKVHGLLEMALEIAHRPPRVEEQHVWSIEMLFDPLRRDQRSPSSSSRLLRCRLPSLPTGEGWSEGSKLHAPCSATLTLTLSQRERESHPGIQPGACMVWRDYRASNSGMISVGRATV